MGKHDVVPEKITPIEEELLIIKTVALEIKEQLSKLREEIKLMKFNMQQVQMMRK